MTKRVLRSSMPVMSTRRRTWKQTMFQGLAAAAAVLGVGAFAVMVPLATPSPVATPLVKGLYMPVSESARAAYIQAMLNNGYEFLPLMQLDDA